MVPVFVLFYKGISPLVSHGGATNDTTADEIDERYSRLGSWWVWWLVGWCAAPR